MVGEGAKREEEKAVEKRQATGCPTTTMKPAFGGAAGPTLGGAEEVAKPGGAASSSKTRWCADVALWRAWRGP